MDLWSESLAMHMASKVIAKLGSMTYQAKSPERPVGIKKNRTVLGKLNSAA